MGFFVGEFLSYYCTIKSTIELGSVYTFYINQHMKVMVIIQPKILI